MIQKPQTKTRSNYQISGINPNYSYEGNQNLPFDQSSISGGGYNNSQELNNDIAQQQKFVSDYSSFKPQTTFDSNNLTNSSNLENLQSYSQFNTEKNFAQSKPIMFMPDTKNKHETLYDNLNENLLKESLKEYRMNIDSIDRDIQMYPDPFNYVVHLGPVTNSGINSSVARTGVKQELKSELKKSKKTPNHTKIYQELEKSNKTDQVNLNYLKKLPANNSVSQDTILDSNDIFVFDNPEAIKEYTVNLERSFSPNIIRDFKNVSYVRLDCAVVPKYTSICINECWDFCRKKHHKKNYFKDEFDRIKDYIILNSRYIPDERNEYNPLGDRFIQIFIKELQSVRNFGTNSITDKSFLLIYDKTLGALYLKLIPYSASKSYKDSLLGNLTKLSIQFFDSWGKPLKINTSSIDYEINQIAHTDLVDPEYIDIDKIINRFNDTNISSSKNHVKKCIERFNEIIKCFVMINSNIEHIIPFYMCGNHEPYNNIHEDCIDFKTLELNQTIFEIKDFYKELNQFVGDGGFVDKIKLSKNSKKVKVGIDEYINNVVWYGFEDSQTNREKIINNLRAFEYNYKEFGFKILDLLKNEIVNIPLNKNFQNFLTFLVGVWEDELNTKIDYYV
jgi:hypothetical protein